jgi:hypothetical protein
MIAFMGLTLLQSRTPAAQRKPRLPPELSGVLAVRAATR